MLIKMTKKVVLNVSSYFIINLLYTIKLFSGFQFSVLPSDRIGHLAGEIDQFLRKQIHTNKKEKRIIITNKVCNYSIYKILSRYTNLIESPHLYRILSYIIRHFPNQKIIKKLGMTLCEFSLYNDIKSVVSMSDNEIEKGYKLIKNLYGMKKDSWWVCFHSRDNSYFEKNFKKNFDYHNYRNCDIENMLPAMKLISKLGGYAIRYGADEERPLSYKDEKIIDYSFNGRSDFLDIFLIAKSRFFVGTTSGTSHVAKLFSVPYLMTNYIPFFPMPEQPQSMFLLKKITNQNKKMLTYKQCYDIGLFTKGKGNKFSFNKTYEEMNLVPTENTKKEILEATKDMINMIDGTKKSCKFLEKNIKIKQQFYSNYKNFELAGQIAPSFIKINAQLF